jgi:hypothetical protein
VLGVISNLKNLVSMDVYIPHREGEHDSWDQHRLSQLQIAHPKLRKVFIEDNGIWVLQEGTSVWEKHMFLHAFTGWDIITGMYDSI